MFFNKKKVTKPDAPFTPEKLDEVINILETVGFVDQWGFRDHAMSTDSYHGGSFEWTDRGVGMRYLFFLSFTTGQVTEARAVLHPGYGFTQAQVDEANKKLAEIL